MSWSSSNRRSQLPPDWRKRVAATKRRADGLCQAIEHDPRCDGVGAECDHRSDPMDHDDLQWLNHWCHAAKTKLESAAARHSAKRPARRHPADN